MHSPYLPDDVTDEMIENAYGIPVPDEYCICKHCEHFDSSWLVCKLACQRNGIPTVGIAMDNALAVMNEQSDEYKELERSEHGYCEEFEFDSNTVDDSPDDVEY